MIEEGIGAFWRLYVESLAAGICNPVYGIALWITYRRYRREQPKTAWQRTLQSGIWGLAVGSFGMLLVCVLGLSVKVGMDLILLFPMALLLSKIRPRFACFAYSGACVGILGLWNLADVSGILATVGLLHFMEVFLIASGAPIQEQFVVYGGRVHRILEQKAIWALPFALLIPVAGEGGLHMPAWWPLWGNGENFAVFPMTALVFYETREVRGKSIWKLLGYSVLLLGLALWDPQDIPGKILCLALMVGIHEGMLLVSFPKARYNKKESEKKET
ncbi:MAG: hypothetical protein ACLU6B_05015 [Lachnospirales bacterium]